MDNQTLNRLDGSEFLTLYLDKLWPGTESPWYLRGRNAPYIITRPRDMSPEDFEKLSSLVGGGKKNGAWTGMGRSKLITQAFSMGGGRKRADDLLQLAGYDRLYARDARDAGLIFALNNGMSQEEWQDKIQPISARYDAAPEKVELIYVDQLRAYVDSRRQMQAGRLVTLDLTGQAAQTLDSLRGGTEQLEAYLAQAQIVAVRDRVRFYLCRALLEAIDFQIAAFEQARERMNGEKKPYDRTAAAELLPKLVYGSVRYGQESLRFATQTKAKFDALTPGDFDDFKIHYAWLCRELSYLYGGEYAWLNEDGEQPGYSMRGMSSENVQRFFSGGAVPGRGTFMRLLVFLDSVARCDMSFARLDGMLTACGFAGPDLRNVDDRFLLQLMLWPTLAQRQTFVTDFLTELEDEGLSYPTFRLLEAASRTYPEFFETERK